MMRRVVLVVVALGLLGLAAFWLMTAPQTLSASDLPEHEPDLVNGEAMFWAGGCESCHAAPGADGDALLSLGGGEALVTPFGVFHPPNISPDPDDGIGAWSLLDFVNAMKFGVAPDGSHLYPAFPYTSYQRMTLADIIDLKAFMDTLPPVTGNTPEHELDFPYTVRRGIGAWKRLYVDGRDFQADPARDAVYNRGAYLVEGPAHCSECHTPRNAFGGPDMSRYMAGGPAPEGRGSIPDITTHEDAIGWWTEDDLVTMFADGITPNFDGLGGSMGAVQRNLARLDRAELEAMAAYVKSIPPIAPQE